ncbi:mediator of RNA polymerase II transcription subunit 16 [Hyposmocoma kahamanoa]|uniref:mediator of RNA polymerase II transcription subunit 16 n=1 Tax=Hyposmocoma kahamanoa TaxID=1477025 RepID=UPI000E6DA089|nr:mediator of RNA polymerase II transcription subunit 16 [Hyposmocoma kahamanoa]
MELIYSMRRKPLKCEPPHLDRVSDSETTRPICTISVCNIIAFSSSTELLDADGDTWGGHVYVCDLDTPWDSHKVTSTSHPVSALEWDCEGKHLLIATSEGDISVYGQKDYLLNEWTCLYSVSFPGEQIIKCVFFHNGRRFAWSEKKPDVPIADRIQMLRPAPTLKGFGGVACEGLLLITATGLVGAVTPYTEDSGKPTVATETLRAKRDRVVHASFAHKGGGVLLAAACRSGGRWCARCCVAAVTLPPCGARLQRHALALQPLPTVHLSDASPSCLSWWVRDDSEWLVVGGSTLALWKLTERHHAVHKLFNKGPLQGSTTPGGGQKAGAEGHSTLVWQQAGAWRVEAGEGGCVIGCARGAVTSMAVMAAGRKIHLLARDSHNYLSSRPVLTSGGDVSEPKKAKYGHPVVPSGASCALVSSVALAALGGAAAAVDTHAQLHVYRLPPAPQDLPPALQVQHAVGLLEYALVSGYDFLDVLLTLKPNIVELVYERFTESFARQPPAFQQHYFHGCLRIRAALCRAGAGLSAAAGALQRLQALCECWAAAGGALRADDRNDIIFENSCILLGSSNCSASEYWYNNFSYELHSDPAAIALLRKLVVVARGSAACLDHNLSRMLARLQAGPPKADLLEECAALNAQKLWARVWEAAPRCSVSAPHGRPLPLFLQYGAEPEWLRVSPEPPSALADAPPPPAMDSIRRACGRCGAVALAAALPGRHPLQRAHDARFLEACRCGGKWTLFSNV